MERARVSFVARLVVKGEPRFVGPAGQLVVAEEDAQRFELWASSTPTERFAMDQVVHQIAGGLEKYIDLSTGVDNAQRLLEVRAETIAFPEGRPVASTLDQQKEQAKRLEEARADVPDSDPLKAGFSTLSEMQNRLQFLAMWQVLLIDPEDWRRLADMQIGDDVFYAVWGGYVDAQRARERGNSPSSGPSNGG